MPKVTQKKRKSTRRAAPLPSPNLMPGFTQSDAPYRQMLAYLGNLAFSDHDQFDYKMSDFNPNHTVTLVDDDGNLMAYFVLLPSIREACKFNEKKHKFLQIGLLEVLPNHRNKRLGSRLLDQITVIARQGGYKEIRTFAIESAVEFYHKYGFVTDISIPSLNVCLTL